MMRVIVLIFRLDRSTDTILFGQWSIRARHVNYSGCMGIEFAIVKGMFGGCQGVRVNSGVRTYRGLFYRAYVILRPSRKRICIIACAFTHAKKKSICDVF